MNKLIFTDLADFEVGTIEYPKLDLALKGLATNVDKVMDYERRSVETLNSDHPLLKMLDTMTFNQEDTARAAYLHALDAFEAWAAANKITTSAKAQPPHLNEFLGGGDIEFLLSSVSRIAPTQFSGNKLKNWETLVPLKFVATGYHDSFPWFPGKAPKKNNGWAVITIDLPMLAVMYHQWSKENAKQENPDTRANFLRKFVLNNSIPSLQNTKMLNRLARLSNSLDVDWVRGESSVGTVDWEGRLVKAQSTMVIDSKNTALNWVELLRKVKINLDVDLEEFTKMIDTRESGNNRWLIVLANIPLWNFLLVNDKDRNANQGYRERLRILMKELRRERGEQSMRDYHAINVVVDEFDRIEKTVKR